MALDYRISILPENIDIKLKKSNPNSIPTWLGHRYIIYIVNRLWLGHG